MSAADSDFESFVLQARQLFGDDLEGVFLYGSAVTGEFRRNVSDYNLGLVLRDLRPEFLKRASGKLARWGNPGPVSVLFLDPPFISAGARLFPIEFSDMKLAHRTLYGEDPLVSLAIAPEALRRQCERELHAQLLGLRQGYFEHASSDAEVLTLLQDSLKSLLIILRNSLTLIGESGPPRLAQVLDRVEARWGLALPAWRCCLAVRAGQEKVKHAEIHGLYAAFLGEARAVAERFPGMLAGESRTS